MKNSASSEIGRRPNYYADSKEDALVMMKDLAKLLPPGHEGAKKRNCLFKANGKRLGFLIKFNVPNYIG